MAERQIVRDRACVQCGISPIVGYKFCSDACFYKARYNKRSAEPGFVERNRANTARSSERKRQRLGRACRNCGATHSAKRTQFCSPECKEAGAASVYAARVERNRPELTPAKCQECSSEFVPSSARPQLFCSHGCQRKWHWRSCTQVRRARLAGVERERVDPFRVFERDGWRCHMCKRITPKRLRGTHSALAPELDHIVPISKGGAHTYANTACSCRECNGRKGSTIYGQPSLLAA